MNMESPDFYHKMRDAKNIIKEILLKDEEISDDNFFEFMIYLGLEKMFIDLFRTEEEENMLEQLPPQMFYFKRGLSDLLLEKIKEIPTEKIEEISERWNKVFEFINKYRKYK